MASFNFVIDTKRLEQKLTLLERKVLPAARRTALNFVARDARQTVQAYMSLSLDKPTAYTLRSVRYSNATEQRPYAEVYISSDPNKGVPPSKYLQEHVRPGRRGQKPSERLLERAGLIGRGEGWAPARSVRLNRYGNVPPAKLVQILSQVKAFSEVGFKANVTSRSRARNKNRAKYFVPNPRTRNRLKPGVYERHGYKGRKIRPVLLFTKLPTYQKRFDFFGAVRQDVNRRLPDAFRRALRYEMRRAGMR